MSSYFICPVQSNSEPAVQYPWASSRSKANPIYRNSQGITFQETSSQIKMTKYINDKILKWQNI
jgi:hypothetical protein